MANNKVALSDGTVLIDLSGDTVTSSDHIMSGYVGHLANGSIVTGTGSGGGASNIVTGTFTGTTSGAALSISLDYSGSGYPIAVVVCPAEGAYKSGTTLYTTIHKYAILLFAASKCDTSTTPSYVGSGANDKAVSVAVYKNSDSDATSTSLGRKLDATTFASYAASDSPTVAVRFSSATEMSVYITGASSGGFLTDIPYQYTVLYSS